ncbi:MAG: SEC-C metal-binding domain-containing protein, partial [Patescibacteria group bacterium]
EGRKADAEARSRLVEFLIDLSKSRYGEMRRKINNPEMVLEMEKGILLRAIDSLWVDHLVAIDYLRAGIGLRGYGQRDPLVEYKKEMYRLFSELLDLIQKEVVYSFYKLGVALDLAPSLMQRSGIQMSGAAKDGGSTASVGPIRTKEFAKNAEGVKVGRNDLCPCGSGKKFKRCHGA